VIDDRFIKDIFYYIIMKKIILLLSLILVIGMINLVSAHQYIADENFGSIQFNVGSIEEGANADGVDFASTLFLNFVNGASARYTIQDASYDQDVYVIVAEFQNDISFSDFEENYVNVFTQDGNYDIDYDPANVGESLPDAQILIVGYYTGRDGQQLASTYVWTSNGKFISISIEDFRSIEGISDKETDFHSFLTSYIEKHPSTLVKKPSCTEAGYKCTSAVRGCGLDYEQKDYDCGAGSAVICCEEISYCGDNICDTEIDYPYPEDADNCPEDCATEPEDSPCIKAGYKCTSAVRGCGHYIEKDLSCNAGVGVICCSEIPFCGDGVCFEHDYVGYGESRENCPEDCGDTMDSCLDKPNKYWDQKTEKCYDYNSSLIKELCDDPDGGKKPYTLAHTFGFRSYSSADDLSRDLRIRTGGKDGCLDDNTLREYYCSSEGYITSRRNRRRNRSRRKTY